MEDKASILVVDNEVNIRTALARILEKEGYSVAVAETGRQALTRCQEERFHLVLTDLKMPDLDGIGLLGTIKERYPGTEVIIMTAFGAVDSAVESMKQGAYDYLTKPLEHARLRLLVRKALEKQSLGAENLRLREQLRVKEQFECVVGKSPAMRRVYDLVKQVANTTATVLLQGESGVGKELIARTIHQQSDRRGRPFVAINCGALPETLLESELFGYERGAFTGATTSKKGKIELADGGTLFLDEVGELSPRSQVDFLRVLETKEFRRLGGIHLVKVDLRIIAASNQDLEEKIKEGSFRDDLYYRLKVVPVRLPPLRERREDIPLLMEAFLREFAHAYGREQKELSAAARQVLINYVWPGNVRELRNLMERLVVTIKEQLILPEHLPEGLFGSETGRQMIAVPLGRPLREVEEEIIKRTLQEVTTHRERAAKLLGISPRALHYKLRRYGIEGRKGPGAHLDEPPGKEKPVGDA